MLHPANQLLGPATPEIPRNDAMNRRHLLRGRSIAKALHGANLLLELFSARQIGLIDGEDVGHFHQARFYRLHIVTQTRHKDNDGDIGEARDFDLVLAHADRLNYYQVKLRGIQQERQLERALRDAAHPPARGH